MTPYEITNFFFLLKRQILIIKGRRERNIEELIGTAILKNSFLIGHCFINHANTLSVIFTTNISPYPSQLI